MSFEFGKSFLSPNFLLFARLLAGVPPFPVNNDGIKFNSVTNKWELAPFGGAGEANTSSNVGVGAGWALPKVGVDLPFKSFIALAPLLLTVNPNDITISITTPTPVNTFILGVMDDSGLVNGSTEYLGVFSDDPTSGEAGTHGFLAFDFTLVRYTLRVNTNSKNSSTTFSFRDDLADVVGTPVTVAGGVTGSFDSGALSVVILANSLFNFQMIVGVGGGTLSDYSQLCECEK